MVVRIAFNKLRTLKYISHLDLNRVFKKLFIRTGLPLIYSEGYNPHPKIVFASTLPLGMESYAEFVDVKIKDGWIDSCVCSEAHDECTDLSLQMRSFSDIKHKLSEISPEGLEIKNVYVPEKDFKYIDYTTYEIYLEADKINPDIDMTVEKQSKTKRTMIDLKDYMKNLSFCTGTGTVSKITVSLPSNGSVYISPELLIAALKKDAVITDYYFVKKQAYDIDGNAFY